MVNPDYQFTRTKRYRIVSYVGIEPKVPTLTKNDDLILVLARAGDPHAFNELWNRHHRKLFRLAYKIVKNSEDAEDVIQESFLKAYKNLKGFDGRSQFSTWMSRIVINGALGVLRKKRPGEVSIDCNFGEEAGSWDLPDRSSNAESDYLRAEQYNRLRTAIHGLPEHLRCVVELLLVQEGSIGEVAESAGISLAATKSRLLRARINLRQTLNPVTIR